MDCIIACVKRGFQPDATHATQGALREFLRNAYATQALFFCACVGCVACVNVALCALRQAVNRALSGKVKLSVASKERKIYIAK